jgi:hypothetical protein
LEPGGVGEVVAVEVLAADPNVVLGVGLGFEFEVGVVLRIRLRALGASGAQGVDAPLVAGGDFVGLGGGGGVVGVNLLAGGVADFQFVGFDDGCAGEAVPVGDGFVVFVGVVFAAVFEGDAGVFSEGEEVGEEEAVGGVDFVEVVFGFFELAGADGVAGEGERHVSPAPVVTAAAPFLGAGAVGLGGHGVVEVEAGVAFEGGEGVGLGEDEGGADEGAGPVAAAFGLAGVEEDEVAASGRIGGVVFVGGVEV